jgi:tetratricopeptide (TPR) repeat protein
VNAVNTAHRRSRTPDKPPGWRRRRRGFIILFGSRTIVSDEAAEPLVARCPRCGREANLRARGYRHWFTLFFIPIFPISGRTRFTQCSACGAQFQLPPEELRARLTATDQQQTQQAIGLYNSLRASPANSVTLNQLMTMYAEMKEYDQAVSAAADFPQALQASEQCMATLGRVYLAQNKYPEAVRWFDAAVARNAQFGEALYYKAIAHLLTSPPEPEKAVVAARTARNAGYPNSDALLREAEGKVRGE